MNVSVRDQLGLSISVAVNSTIVGLFCLRFTRLMNVLFSKLRYLSFRE